LRSLVHLSGVRGVVDGRDFLASSWIEAMQRSPFSARDENR
jgi:hypothetical protein